jgi:hypothetical protein
MNVMQRVFNLNEADLSPLSGSRKEISSVVRGTVIWPVRSIDMTQKKDFLSLWQSRPVFLESDFTLYQAQF